MHFHNIIVAGAALMPIAHAFQPVPNGPAYHQNADGTPEFVTSFCHFVRQDEPATNFYVIIRDVDKYNEDIQQCGKAFQAAIPDVVADKWSCEGGQKDTTGVTTSLKLFFRVANDNGPQPVVDAVKRLSDGKIDLNCKEIGGKRKSVSVNHVL